MKNFDEARTLRSQQDRDFQIGGETFRVKAGVRPEVLAKYDQITEETNVTDTLAIVDELIVGMIEPGDNAAERYHAIRARDDDAITVEDLLELAKWLMEVQTGRPTERLGDSSDGPPRTGMILKDASSSPDIPVLTS